MRLSRPLTLIFLSACSPRQPTPGATAQAVYSSSCPSGPTATIDTSAVPTKTGATWSVNSSATLTNALANAVGGDEIVLDPTVTYTGTFTLRPQTSGKWIIIRTSNTTNSSFPAAGHRVEKAHFGLLAKIVAPSTGAAAITTGDGTDHKYWLIGLDISAGSYTGNGGYGSLVHLGERGSQYTTNQASNIVLDRVYVHGNPSNSSISVNHAITMDGAYLAIINSRIADIHEPNPGTCDVSTTYESQGINSINGSGPYKIDNCYISASTQGFMFGGDDAASASMVPSDITVTNNHIYKPVTTAWRSTYLAKTGLEFKVGNRILMSGNYVENAWNDCSDENAGGLFRLTVRDQSGTQPASNITHAMIKNNKFLNAPKGIGILASDPDGGPSGRMNCVAFSNNLFDKIPGDFSGDHTDDGGMGRVLTLENGGMGGQYPGGAQNLTFDHNTIINTSATDGNAFTAFWTDSSHTDLNSAFIWTNNIVKAAAGGLHCVDYPCSTPYEGDIVFSEYFNGVTFNNNDFIDSANSSDYSTACSGVSCYWHTTAQVAFQSGSWQLSSSSPDKSAGSDGKDIGVYDWSCTGVGAADAARDVQPDSPPSCTTCGSDCFDTTRDPWHCGGCSTVCSSGQSCVNSVCTTSTCGGGGGGGGSGLFSDDFNRSTGLGSSWTSRTGSTWSTDGANAVAGTPPANGDGNWADLTSSLSTNDYAVTASLSVPTGSLYSGIFARSASADMDEDLYAAQIATDGHVNLYRRNSYNWAQLVSAATTITAGTFYTVKLVVSGSSPVHLEVWLNGTQMIEYDDSSASAITSGKPGIQNYDSGVKYDSFEVDPVTSPLFSDDFTRTTGLGSSWSSRTGSTWSTDGANAVAGTPPANGDGNWADLTSSLGTNNYAVTANLTVPTGTLFSGIFARSASADMDEDLYAAQIATDGHVNLYRRNAYTWTLLSSVAATVTANVEYPVMLVTTGSSPVHCEVWFNGTKLISYDDSSASKITTGVPGIQNYDSGVKYDNFRVDAR